MARQLAGNLVNGLNEGQSGTLIFRALANNETPELVIQSEVSEPVSNGSYNVTLSNGTYQVYFNNNTVKQPLLLGNVVIATGAQTTLLHILEEIL